MRKIIASTFIISLAATFLLQSCAPQKEVVRPPKEEAALPSPVPVEPMPEAKPESEPSAPLPLPKVYRPMLRCEDKTEAVFNRSGIEILPFLRIALHDFEGDGKDEMILGSKDGSLRLYRIDEGQGRRTCSLVANYFEGVRANAFSAPAVGDLDNDGIPEVLVGTGGFSADSGRVLLYRNRGSAAVPSWELISHPGIAVGNDAAPALFDVDNDGRLDLIVGNSTGNLFLFRNKSGGGRISLVRDSGYFRGVNLGMYAVPAATSAGDRIVIIAGNSMGKIVLLERERNGNGAWQRRALDISTENFAAPTFMQDRGSGRLDLIVADGYGEVLYFRNRNGSFRDWDEERAYLSDRVLAGPACAPVVTRIGGKSFMVVGNINGELRMFESDPSGGSLTWTEKHHFFRRIKLSGFSRGVITEWGGRILLIAGQQDGMLRAFMNTGSMERPVWSEEKGFFNGVPKIMHAAPTVFDIDGDGRWELVVGDVKGYVWAYRFEIGRGGKPLWERVPYVFSFVKVGRFAVPTLFRDGGEVYLLVGQEDGRISVYRVKRMYAGLPIFYDDDFLQGIQMKNHSAPAVSLHEGAIGLAVGDYDGNLRHFACFQGHVEVTGN